jgi:N-acetylglucosamine repressor
MLKRQQSMVRSRHSQTLFNLIKNHKEISRVDLTKITGMSGTSVGRIVNNLIEEGLVLESGHIEGNVGRKAILLRVNPNGAFMIGVHLDTDFIQAGVIDLHGNVIVSIQENIDIVRKKPEEILANVVDVIQELYKSIGAISTKILGVGVSIPGIVSWPEGKAINVPQFNWKNVEVRKYLEQSLKQEIIVDNQVKIALLGENVFGNIAGVENAVCLFVGSGVGAAVIENDLIMRGNQNALGEVGHITIDPGGPLCDCGRFGCLQAYICISALEKEAGTTIDNIFHASQNGETWAKSLIKRATEYTAIAISNIVCMYNPEVILLSGSMIEEYPNWRKEVEQIYKKYIFTALDESFEIRYSTLGAYSQIIGAGSLVLNNFLQMTTGEIKNNKPFIYSNLDK